MAARPLLCLVSLPYDMMRFHDWLLAQDCDDAHDPVVVLARVCRTLPVFWPDTAAPWKSDYVRALLHAAMRVRLDLEGTPPSIMEPGLRRALDAARADLDIIVKDAPRLVNAAWTRWRQDPHTLSDPHEVPSVE